MWISSHEIIGRGLSRVVICTLLLLIFIFLPKQNCIDEIESVISVKLQLIGIVGIGTAGFMVRIFLNLPKKP